MINKLLYYINEEENISQRKLADKLSVSLGKVNSLIKKGCEKGFIEIDKNVGVTNYNISKLGFDILSKEIENQNKEKININRDGEYKVSTAVILSAGEREGFEVPVSALELEGKPLINDIIDKLNEFGIKNIVVVAGYKKKVLEDLLKDESNVTVVENSKFKWTGSMASLKQVKDLVSDDFLLIEGDLIFEKKALEEIVKSKKRNCILITNESGSGDEGFVQIKEGNLFKLGKDIHQFNRIDGEMIGISKISHKLFELMLEEFEGNINPYINYEYILLDVARDYKVPCVKVDDLAWGEIDNIDQYSSIKNYIAPKIKRKEILIEKNQIRDILRKCLDLDKCEVTEYQRIGGMTNKNYKIKVNGELIILRLPGVGTDKMIDRKSEIRNVKLLSDKEIDADILYIDEESGIKISKYIKGAETLTGRSAKKEENMILVTNLIRKLHYSDIKMDNSFDVFTELRKYEHIIYENNYKFYSGYRDIRDKIVDIENLIKIYGVKYVPSHNDTLPDNFIKDENGRMYLIDWEYSGMNDELWDVAAHAIEAGFSDAEEELFLDYYFKGETKESDKIKLLMNKIMQDMLWSLWTIIKENEGEDYGNYGIDRYNRGRKNLEELYKIIKNEGLIYGR